jgi:hypothetical protein
MAQPLAIFIKDKELSPALYGFVVAARIVESSDDLDTLAVEFAIPFGSAADDIMKLATPGVSMKLSFSTDEGTLSRTGDALEVVHRRSPSGWTVALHGLERLHRLRKMSAVPKVWEGSHTMIVRSIAQSAGLTAKAEGVDDTANYTLQMNSDNATFLKQLAFQHNYYLRVEGMDLKFGRRHVTTGKPVALKIDADISSFELRASLYEMATEVVVHGHDYVQAKPVTGRADKSKLAKISGGDTGPAIAREAFGGRDIVLPASPVTATTTANALALAELQRRADQFLRGVIRCSGRPDARSGRKLEVEGATWPMHGPFVIRQTRHSYEGGRYGTVIEFYSDSYPRAV